MSFLQLVNLINLRPSDKLELLRLCDTREVSFKAKFALEPYGRYHVLMLHYFLPLQRISLSLRLLGNAEQGCRVQ